MTPAGSRLLPDFSAVSAPASTMIVPRGSRWLAIHALRAEAGVACGANQVARAPASIAASGFFVRPLAITIAAPAAVAIFPASILVFMPPRDSSEPAEPAIASIAGVIAGTKSMKAASGFGLRRRGVEAVDVGEEHEAIGADHRRDARGEAVVVAVADFGGRHRVVLVDDGHGAAS